MSRTEYEDLARRMDRIEQLLARLAGVGPGLAVTPVPAVEPASQPSLEMSETSRVRSVQEEGHYILVTQGLDAYKAFWKEQGKKRKHRLKRAA